MSSPKVCHSEAVASSPLVALPTIDSDRTVYLDYAATAPLLLAAKDAMSAVLDGLSSGKLGNPSSLHGPGQASKALLDQAYESVARLIHAAPEQLIFTSGGSESNNLVTAIFAGRDIAVSEIEHPSVLKSAAKRAGKLYRIPVDSWGRVDRAKVIELAPQVDLISIMLANNEIGTLEPIRELVQACREVNPRLRFHTDATQAFGKIKIDVQDLDVDYLTISSHKIGGPVGIGALYVKTGAPFKPLIYGGHQARGRRAGTESVLLASGFGAAAQWCWDNWSCQKWQRVSSLRDQLFQRIVSQIPAVERNSPESDCLPSILNLTFTGVEGESIQLYLDLAGIAVSTGSACASDRLSPSPVLMATHHDAVRAHGSIRFSLGLDTSAADIDRVMAVLPQIITYLRGISTLDLTNSGVKS